MSALGFTAPGMLIALAAGALPILIHFLTRPRPRVIPFPPLRFLIEAGAGRQSLHRLRTWILLALRGLATAALGLLFARPFLHSDAGTEAPGEPRRAVLVVDASCSMRAATAGVTLFAHARAEAAEVLGSLESGSSAGVVFIGARSRAALPGLTRNLHELHDALVRAEPTLECGDPVAAMALAQRMLDGRGAVYVFSDFQRTNWSAVRLGEDWKGIACYLRPAAASGHPNRGITEVHAAPLEPVSGEPTVIGATVFNATAEPRQETVRLELFGSVQEKTLDLKPFASAEASFAVVPSEPGYAVGEVRLGGDGFGEDDRRVFALRVRRALRILVISDRDSTDLSGSAFFVRTALAPIPDRADAASAAGLAVDYRRSQETDLQSLSAADLVVLTCPVTFSVPAAEAVARRVMEGAPLLCLLDGPTAPGLLGGLGTASEGVVSPPFTLVRAVEAASNAPGETLGRIQAGAGPLALFSGPEQGDLSRLSFSRHYQTRINEARADEICAYFADGSAAVAVSPAGRGSALYANFPVDPRGGPLVGSPLFPALLAEFVRTLRSGTEPQGAAPGQAWNLDVSSRSEPDASWKVTDPAGGLVTFTVIARGRTVRLAMPAASALGPYAVRIGSELAAVGTVNVDPRETDTREMRPDFSGGPATVRVLTAEGESLAAGRARDLWPLCLAVVALGWGLEMLLLSIWRAPRMALSGPRASPPAAGKAAPDA